MLLFHDNFKDLYPLLTSWITPTWVLGAGLEKEDLLVLHFLEVFEHALHVKTLGHWIVIPEIFLLKTGISDDAVMK
jgi:hypothetical protein